MALDDSDSGNMSIGGGDNDNGEVINGVASLDVEEYDEDEDEIDDITIDIDVAPDDNTIGGVDDVV